MKRTTESSEHTRAEHTERVGGVPQSGWNFNFSSVIGTSFVKHNASYFLRFAFHFTHIAAYASTLISNILLFEGLAFSKDEYFLTLRYDKVNLRQGPSYEYPIKIFYKKKFLPVLIQDKFDNFSKIDRIRSTLLIVSGLKDEVIPHFHSKLLFEKANTNKKSLFIDEAMHNNLYDFGIEKTVISFSLSVWK